MVDFLKACDQVVPLNIATRIEIGNYQMVDFRKACDKVANVVPLGVAAWIEIGQYHLVDFLKACDWVEAGIRRWGIGAIYNRNTRFYVNAMGDRIKINQ